MEKPQPLYVVKPHPKDRVRFEVFHHRGQYKIVRVGRGRLIVAYRIDLEHAIEEANILAAEAAAVL